MLRRSSLIAVLAILVLAIAACGVDPDATATPTATSPPAAATPTPTETPVATPAATLGVTCLSTEAYALEHIVAVIDQDVVPTGFDAINGGSCEVSEPVVQLRITLTSETSEQIVTIDLTSATTSFAVPLADAAIPTLSATLKPGRYERDVVAIAADGSEIEVQGFEPVILVLDRESTQSDLLRAQSRWERSGIDAYTYTAAWNCFCPPEYRAPVAVEVQGKQVVSVTFVDTDFAGSAPGDQWLKTIDDLFSLLQDAHDRDAHSISVEYHEQLGYPMSAFIDYLAMVADEEQGFSVSDIRY